MAGNGRAQVCGISNPWSLGSVAIPRTAEWPSIMKLTLSSAIKGWPWKRKMAYLTDSYGLTWTHAETYYDWWTWRWVSIWHTGYEASNETESKP
jgi:hypothetical protein